MTSESAVIGDLRLCTHLLIPNSVTPWRKCNVTSESAVIGDLRLCTHLLIPSSVTPWRMCNVTSESAVAGDLRLCTHLLIPDNATSAVAGRGEARYRILYRLSTASAHAPRPQLR